MKFELFDAVELKEPATLSEGQIIPAGVHGAIVEVFDQGEAYLVELFGEWVKTDHQGERTGATAGERCLCRDVGCCTALSATAAISAASAKNSR